MPNFPPGALSTHIAATRTMAGRNRRYRAGRAELGRPGSGSSKFSLLRRFTWRRWRQFRSESELREADSHIEGPQIDLSTQTHLV